MRTKAQPRRGRPRLHWLTGQQLAALPWGTAVVLDLGHHKTLRRGRIAGRIGDELHLTSGEQFKITDRTRGRVVNGTFDAGDFVLRRGVPESEWIGGVVRTRGHEVYVESINGFEWMDEALLEPADPDPANGPLEATGS